MATVPEIQELKPEDFEKEDRELVTRLAQPFNDFNSQIVQCLNKSLTFGENFRGEVRSFVFKSGETTKTFRYNSSGTPSSLFIAGISAAPSTAIFPYWTQDGKGSVTVQIIGTLPSQDVTITFVILAG